MSNKLPAQVRVQCETPMLGLAWHEVAELSRTELVEAAIASGRLTVTDEQEQADVSAVPDGDGPAADDAAAVESGDRPAPKVTRRTKE